MTNQVVVAKKQSTVAFTVYYVTLLFLVTSMIAMFGAAAYLSLITHEYLFFGMCSTLLLVSVWAWGGSYITIPMSLYLNQKYSEKRYGELEAAHSRALRLLNKLPFRKSIDVPVMTSNLALMRLCQGNYDSAEDLFRHAYSYAGKDRQLRDTFAAAILVNNLACACLRRGNYVEAELHANRALEILELKKNKQFKVISALPHAVIGNVHCRLGEYDTSIEHFLKAIQIYDTEKAPVGTINTSLSQGKTQVYLWLAYDYIKVDKISESEKICDRAFVLIEQDAGAVNALTLEVLYMLANEYMNLRKMDRAEKLLEIAYGLCAETPFHPDAKPLLNYFEKLLLLTDRQNEVADMRAWLLTKNAN